MYHYHRRSLNPLLFIAGLAIGAIFAPKIKRKLEENESWRNVKEGIRDKFDRTKEDSQEVYNRMVDEVTDKYAKAKGISRNELADLTQDLKWHWNRIKDAWNEE